MWWWTKVLLAVLAVAFILLVLAGFVNMPTIQRLGLVLLVWVFVLSVLTLLSPVIDWCGHLVWRHREICLMLTGGGVALAALLTPVSPAQELYAWLAAVIGILVFWFGTRIWKRREKRPANAIFRDMERVASRGPKYHPLGLHKD